MPDFKDQQVLAYYFPQYHPIPENDVVFGEGFTDWELFCTNTHPAMSACKFPLPPPQGLGFYDPTQKDVREAQGALAKKYGVDGFIYYHYWLENKPVMSKVLNALLTDNEPNLPFCLCFANDSWKQCYGNKTNGTYTTFHPDGSTFRQLYDKPADHAAYLQTFFKHPNYVRRDNRPVLFVYKLTADVYDYLTIVITELKQYGIDDLYLIANTSEFCLRTYTQKPLSRMPDAYSPFAPHAKHPPLPPMLASLPCVYGGFLGWNATPRHPDWPEIRDYSPLYIAQLTYKHLYFMYHDQHSPQLYTLFAWNEWAEGSILEPNTINGEEMGYAVKKARDVAKIVYEHQKGRSFWYGTNGVFRDITHDVYTKCLIMDMWPFEPLRLEIPKDDYVRADMFGDPLNGVVKVILHLQNNAPVAIYTCEDDVCIKL